MDDGTNVQLWIFNNTVAQKFYIDKCSKIVNLEDKFSALIINTDSWKPIMQNDDCNVVLGSETRENMNRILWKFERNSDTGWYTISSYLNDKYLDVDNAGDADCTNVKCYNYHDSIAQKWYILRGENGKTYLKAACSSRNMDLQNGSTNDGTNVQMFAGNNTSAQWFKIYQLNSERDKIDYSITTDCDEINLGDTVKITINNSPYAINYKLHIIDSIGNHTVVDNKCNYVYYFNPQNIGEYTIYAEVFNPLSIEVGSLIEKYVKIKVTFSLGDVNGDSVVNIIDATEIQKHISESVTFDENVLLRADVDRNSTVDIKDATLIQKYCASLITGF